VHGIISLESKIIASHGKSLHVQKYDIEMFSKSVFNLKQSKPSLDSSMHLIPENRDLKDLCALMLIVSKKL
jgi:hypothetical protein